MPSQASARTRRSRAPSPEHNRSGNGDLLHALAKSAIEYSVYRLLTKQTSSTKAPSTSNRETRSRSMPSKYRSSDDSSRAYASHDRDPTHELLSHLVRGAAALAARHLLKKKKQKSTEPEEQQRGRPRDRKTPIIPPVIVTPPSPDQQDRDFRPHRRRRHRRPADEASRAELVVALDALSSELARTTSHIRYLAGNRRPHRHRDGRCDVFEGLRYEAGRLEGRLGDLRAGVNNVRNLGVGMEGGGSQRGGRWEREDMRGDGGGTGRRGSWERLRPDGRGGEKRRVRIREEEGRGRGRTREL